MAKTTKAKAAASATAKISFRHGDLKMKKGESKELDPKLAQALARGGWVTLGVTQKS